MIGSVDLPRVGLVGADVPPELVMAAAARPVRLGPGSITTPVGDDQRAAAHARAAGLLGTVDPAAVDLLAGILTGEHGPLLGIVCSRDREASLRIFYVLRELAAGGESLPFLHLVDMVHLPREASVRYDAAQLSSCAAALGRWTGSEVTADALLGAAQECARTRELLTRASALQAAGRLRGSEVLALHTLAGTEEPDVASGLIERALRAAEGRAVSTQPRLFLSGSAQADTDLYLRLEELRWSVVGDDHDRAALALTIVVDLDSMSNHPDVESRLAVLARAYRDRGPDSATGASRDRAVWIDQAAKASGAVAVLCWVRRHDEGPLWEHPLLRERLEARGVEVALLRDQDVVVDRAALAAVLDGADGLAARARAADVHASEAVR
ncbi:2-hydroxyacyl-CoA dehydratase family protein [Aeromicrobium sp. CF3.5]|uniref:2-hydroxyacyl-CoA dehydratase family protein n=1 Tax=Aeromicrobium sp. CF3.5 TaxID=3373078 RepID=UPI003EE715C8